MQHETREMLEQAALYHAATGHAKKVLQIATPADFTPGYPQDLATLMMSLLAQGQHIDQMVVMTEAEKLRKGMGTWFAVNVSDKWYSEPGYCALKVHEAAQRDRMAVHAARLANAVNNPSTDLSAALEDFQKGFTDWQRAGHRDVPEALSFDDLMALEEDHQPWVVKGMLRRKEVLMLTGLEGGGKSMLMSQWLLGAACGVNTMSPMPLRHDPARVFVVDVENESTQIRDNMRTVWKSVQPHMQEGQKPKIKFSPTKHVNLTKASERNALLREITAAKPDLVYLGSVYQLAPSPDHDEVFFAVKNTVDAIRDEIGSAFLIEHHAGHDKNGDGTRDSRPYGSSMWRRWPNFGVGLVQYPGDKNLRLLQRWRGDRSRGRLIPYAVRESATIPWMPIPEDEFEAMYGTTA